MPANMPSEWFKIGKSHQFEGRHQDAIFFFEKCLAADWRIELVTKEIYNSLVKLRAYSRANEILQHYGHRIQQKEWLTREQLNVNKKLEKTDYVRTAYISMMRELLRNFDVQEAISLANELALYYYRLGLTEAFSQLCEHIESDESLRVFVPLMRSKWLLHFVKDIKQALRISTKNHTPKSIEQKQFQDRTFLADAIKNYHIQMSLSKLFEEEAIVHVYALSDALFYRINLKDNLEIAIGKAIHDVTMADSLLIFDRLLRLECPEWSLPYVIALGKALIRENSVRQALQALAAELVQTQNMQLLESLTIGIPDLYILDKDRDAYAAMLFDDTWPVHDHEEEKISNTSLPIWSKSETDYLDAFIEQLSKGIDKGLVYVKRTVISEIKHFSMTQDETLDALWRLRMHYQGQSLEMGLVWLKQLLDMLVKDVHNVGLWLELPHLVLYLIKRQGLDTKLGSQLVKAANNGFLYALYILDKQKITYPTPERQFVEDAFETVSTKEYWRRYVSFVESVQYFGFELSRWDALYGYFHGVNGALNLEEAWNDRMFTLLYELSQDLNKLTEHSDAMRYLPHTVNRLWASLDTNETTSFRSLSWMFQGFIDLSNGKYGQLASQIAQRVSFAYPIEELNAYLIIITILRYENEQPCIEEICERIEKLAVDTHDNGLLRVYEFLKGRDPEKVGKLGYQLINHALVQMQKAQQVDSQFVSDVRVDFLERVALEEGLALFELMSTLDPTNLVLGFHTIDLKICMQSYHSVADSISNWIKLYEINYGAEREFEQLYETLCYQQYWLLATVDGLEPLQPSDDLSKAILEVKRDTTQGEIEFLRDVFIHHDIEIVFELLKQHGHRPFMQTSAILKLMHLVFGHDFRVMIVALWQHQSLMPLVNAYTQMLKEEEPQVGVYFDSLKRQYRKDYGNFNVWLNFTHGKIEVQVDALLQSLEGSIQYSELERFVWIINFGAFVLGANAMADFVASKLEFYRFTKWSHDSWWTKAFEILPFGKIALEMGKEALRQGRYETAKQCYISLPPVQIAGQIKAYKHAIANQGHVDLKDSDVLCCLDSGISHILGPNGLYDFEQYTRPLLTEKESLNLYLALFARVEAKEFGKGLKEAVRSTVLKSDLEHIILAWYAHEQHLSKHNKVATELESLFLRWH